MRCCVTLQECSVTKSVDCCCPRLHVPHHIPRHLPPCSKKRGLGYKLKKFSNVLLLLFLLVTGAGWWMTHSHRKELHGALHEARYRRGGPRASCFCCCHHLCCGPTTCCSLPLRSHTVICSSLNLVPESHVLASCTLQVCGGAPQPPLVCHPQTSTDLRNARSQLEEKEHHISSRDRELQELHTRLDRLTAEMTSTHDKARACLCPCRRPCHFSFKHLCLSSAGHCLGAGCMPSRLAFIAPLAPLSAARDGSAQAGGRFPRLPANKTGTAGQVRAGGGAARGSGAG